MEKKTCSRCKNEKFVNEFNRNGCGGFQTYCRECKKIQWKDWYSKEENRDKFLKKVRTHRKRYKLAIRQKLFTYLKEHPCIDCGESDISVLHFDHVRGIKEFQISTIRTSSWKKVFQEIKKCEVRCSNCHTKRHAKEDEWYKGLQ